MTIVHHRAIDELRARRRRDRRSATLPAQPVDPQAVDLLEAVAQTLTNEHVRACLHALPAEQREVIRLAYFEGLTHREIADEAGMPLGTVKSRMRLGMEKLRAAFGIEAQP
jgi:RNA polymerase sigma-70 factor (ECF subfamily)